MCASTEDLVHPWPRFPPKRKLHLKCATRTWMTPYSA